MGIADSVINFCSRTGIDSLEDDRILKKGVYRMIVNVRVDHRLLHGQVAMAWNQVLGSDCILIANDSVPNDEIRKAGIKLAKPANTKLVIKNMDASVEALVSGVTDKYKLFIVVESIADVYKLCKGNRNDCKDHAWWC